MSSYSHGHTVSGKHSPTYSRWWSMISRCKYTYNPRQKTYHNKITVCERWQSFENFLADMGEAPDGMTLDRINNNEGYSPINCRWATPKEQANNRKTNILIEFRGETKTLTQWAEHLKIDPRTLYFRVKRWPLERAMTEKVAKVGAGSCKYKK